MSLNVPAGDPFEWTPERERAALLVAEDALTDEQIAAEVGVDRRTLTRWRAIPAFAAKVDEIAAEVCAAIRKYGIARVENRIRRQNRDWNKIQKVIEDRGKHAAQDYRLKDVPGADTGHVVRTYKVAGGRLVEEFAVDVATLGALNSLEQQTAKELGQWVERKELSGSVTVQQKQDLSALSDDELHTLRSLVRKTTDPPDAPAP